MANPVLFFFRTGIFVFFDHTIFVIFNGSTGTNSCLCPSIHSQLIDVIAGFIILNETAILHPVPKHFLCLGINLICVHIMLRLELGLRAVNCKKRMGALLYKSSCFFSVKHIIGKLRNVCNALLRRSDCLKWSDVCHRTVSSSCHLLILLF